MTESFLTIVLIARDEERYIAGALRSAAGVAAELLVVLDPRTRDRTAAIAAEHGARVVAHPFRSFPDQRNFALGLCRTSWVFFLDADERLTPELRSELLELRPADLADAVGFRIPRHNMYFGRVLKGGGWYPDHQLRLLRRDAARYDQERLVHELVQLPGPARELAGHLLHINIESWPELHRKQRGYAIAEAQTLWRAGVRARWRNLVLQPPREVNRRFRTWQGYRDGWLGLALAATMGYYEWVKYVHLKALERAAGP